MHHILKFGIVGIVLFITLSSVAGMASIFKTISVPIGFLMLCIEAAKYGAVAYGYREWMLLTTRFKTILVVFVTMLSLLTSVGIFGYLGNSFQNSHSRAQKSGIDLSSLTAEKQRLEARMTAIDRQVSELPQDFVAGRLKLMQAFADERRELSNRLKTVDDKLGTAQINSVDSLDELGPIVHLSKFFGTTVENAVGYLMVGLACVLDPFALFLTVLLNRQRKPETVEKVVDTVKPPEVLASEWNFK